MQRLAGIQKFSSRTRAFQTRIRIYDPPFTQSNVQPPNVDQRKSCSPTSHADAQEISAKNIAV